MVIVGTTAGLPVDSVDSMRCLLQCVKPSGWGTAAVTDPVEVMVRGRTERDIMEGRRLVLTS